MSDDQEAPHDILAELAVLGGMMANPASIAVAADLLTAEDFYRPGHRCTFHAILGLSERGVEVTATTLADALRRAGELVKAGGDETIRALRREGAEVTPGNVGHYAEIVGGHALSRRVIAAALHVAREAQSGRLSPADLIESARGAVDTAAEQHRRRDGHQGIDLGDAIAERMEQYQRPAPPGLPTGWPEIDGALGAGLRPGSLTIVGASTGVGKSIFGIALAVSAARRGVGSVLATVEMTRDEVVDRILASLAGIDSLRLANHRIADHEWPMLQAAQRRLRDAPLRIEDTSDLSVAKLRALARDQARRPGGLGLVVADYLQLMRPADERAPRQEQVASISRGLKRLAGDFKIPVVAPAQLNREAGKRGDARPRKSDLRESGALEHDSSYVVLLHREPDKPDEILIDLAKNRFGPETSALVPIQPKYSRIGRHLEVA